MYPENKSSVTLNVIIPFHFTYYEIWIRQFLDFVKSDLEDDDIENRTNAFAYTANQEIKSAVEHVIRFLNIKKAELQMAT